MFHLLRRSVHSSSFNRTVRSNIRSLHMADEFNKAQGKEWIRIGLIGLPTDVTMPMEVQNIMPHFPRVITMITRCHFPPDSDEITQSTYEYSAKSLTSVAQTIRPINSCHVLGLSCTSFSFAIGPKKINEMIQKAHPDTKICNMADTLVSACELMGLKRIILLCPYEGELYKTLQTFLAERNIEIETSAALETSENTDFGIFSISPEEIESQLDVLNENSHDKADGIVVCCSAMYMLRPGFISKLEKKYKLPVITSMQAFLHYLIRNGGETKQIEGFGELFSKH